MRVQAFIHGKMNALLGNKSSSFLHVLVFETERNSLGRHGYLGLCTYRHIQSLEPVISLQECKSRPSSLVRLVLSLA